MIWKKFPTDTKFKSHKSPKKACIFIAVLIFCVYFDGSVASCSSMDAFRRSLRALVNPVCPCNFSQMALDQKRMAETRDNSLKRKAKEDKKKSTVTRVIYVNRAWTWSFFWGNWCYRQHFFPLRHLPPSLFIGHVCYALCDLVEIQRREPGSHCGAIWGRVLSWIACTGCGEFKNWEAKRYRSKCHWVASSSRLQEGDRKPGSNDKGSLTAGWDMV